jgi:hypothetical protein
VDVRVAPEEDLQIYAGVQSLDFKEIEAGSSQEHNKAQTKSTNLNGKTKNNRWLYGFKVA